MLKALSSIPVLPNKRKLVQYVRQWAITGALGMGRGRTAEREDCGEGGPQSGRATVREGCRQEGLHCPKKRWDHDQQKRNNHKSIFSESQGITWA